MIDGSELIAQLVAIRVRKHLTQQQIADQCGVHVSTITRFEIDTLRTRTPSLRILHRYAAAVGATIRIEETR